MFPLAFKVKSQPSEFGTECPVLQIDCSQMQLIRSQNSSFLEQRKGKEEACGVQLKIWAMRMYKKFVSLDRKFRSDSTLAQSSLTAGAQRRTYR